MNLQSHRQWTGAQQKLAMIEEQIAVAKNRPTTPENRESLESLVKMANQLREEIVLYDARKRRKAS